MAEQKIQIADKPTLDKILSDIDSSIYGLSALKNLLTNSTYGLSQIKNKENDIYNLLTNSTYGLSSIKSSMANIRGGISYPNIKLFIYEAYYGTDSTWKVTGKGKVTMSFSSSSTSVLDKCILSISIDGVTFTKSFSSGLSLSGSVYIQNHGSIVFTFEKSFELKEIITSDLDFEHNDYNRRLLCIVQLAD